LGDDFEMAIESDQIEKILNQHGERLEEHEEQIHELQKVTAVNSQILNNIETNQNNIEKTLRKNNELYLTNQNNVIQVMEKNTNGILTMSKQFIDYMSKKDKNDNQTEIKLNKGWNRREITLGVLTLLGMAFGLIQTFVK
jgi:hypothetical protein